MPMGATPNCPTTWSCLAILRQIKKFKPVSKSHVKAFFHLQDVMCSVIQSSSPKVIRILAPQNKNMAFSYVWVGFFPQVHSNVFFAMGRKKENGILFSH